LSSLFSSAGSLSFPFSPLNRSSKPVEAYVLIQLD
jgi:hypothetical protein